MEWSLSLRSLVLLLLMGFCATAVKLTVPMTSGPVASNRWTKSSVVPQCALVNECREEGAAEIQSRFPQQMDVDLWIVGCGKLGKLVASKWLDMHPGDVVVGETMSNSSHNTIAHLGVLPRLRSDRYVRDGVASVKRVLISIPPYSKSPDTAKKYLSEVEEAVDLPQNLNKKADCEDEPVTVLISSTSVYDGNAGVVTEFSGVAESSDTPSALRTLTAEKIVKRHRGINMRLAGLYDRNRGPHMFWLADLLKMKKLRDGFEAEGLINLVHYEDAADVTIKALVNGTRGTTYMASDGHPISRKEIIESAAAAGIVRGISLINASDVFKPSSSPSFLKICDSNWTCEQLNWNPTRGPFSKYIKNSD